MARKRGSLLLIAFLAAVMASGGGGVTAPWMPRTPDAPSATITLAQVGPVTDGVGWRFPRME